MSNFFISIFQFLQKHKLVLWLSLVMVVVFCGFGITQMQTDEDIASFLPHDSENERTDYISQHIGALNQLVLTISSTDSSERFDTDLISEAVEILVENINLIDSAHIKSVQYIIEQQQQQAISNFITQNIAYLLTPADYIKIDSLTDKNYIFNKMKANKLILSSPTGSLIKGTLLSDPLGLSIPLLQGLQSFQVGNNFKLIDGYIFNAKGDEATVIVTSNYPSSETNHNATLLRDIQHAIDTTIATMQSKVKISLFSAAAIAATNAQQIKHDSWITVTITLIFIAILLFYFYRNVKSIALIVTSLMFGGLFAIGIMSCFSSSISIIAIGIGSVIIGIATNYPLHFLAHIRHGYTCKQSIRDISAPLLTGNITTIGAFLSLLFISSDAMHDLGIFASLLLAGTIVFVLIYLPHFFTKNSSTAINDNNLLFNNLASFQPEKKWWFVCSILVLTLVFWYFSGNTRFDTNMQNINYMTAEQRQQLNKYTQLMFNQKQTIYCVSEGSSIDQALLNNESLQPQIDSVIEANGKNIKRSGLGVYLPSKQEQQQRINQWNSFWETRRSEVLQNVSAAAKAEGFTPNAFNQFEQILTQEYKPQDISHFHPIIESFGSNYIVDNNENRAMVLSILYVDKEQVKPIEDGLNGINKNLFAFDTSSMTSKLVSSLSSDFDKVLYICGIIVLLFLTISFGRLEIGLLAFIPLTIGWVWILGIMGIADMQFNIVNVILATFIFGQGDDYTIFVTEGLMYEYTHKKKMLKSYKNTVLLSAFIMFIGIGSLIFAKHPAMKSLGEVTVVGMFCVVLMAYVFPPLIFKWLTTKKGKKRPMPITLWNLLKTVLAFIIFFVGSIIITLAGFFLITLGGHTDRNKLLYHRFISASMRFLARLLFEVKFSIHNQFNENFEKPSVIICNHQSHIDLLFTLMLSPKIICLTNKWVWNCPFYGWIIRYADFLPVIDGIEENVDKLASFVNKGYSILVFPEGTRSADCSILRFHQGAFFLAKKLNIDIVPVVTHGIGHVLPKNEFILHKGRVDIKILKRITPNQFSSENRETAKIVRQQYAEEYNSLANEVETTNYFYNLVLNNYIYKGREIERTARKNLKRNSGYKSAIAQLPDSGSIEIENCGQGEFTLMAALVKKNLQITATDSNPELLDIARNCASIPQNLKYVERIVPNNLNN